MGASIGDRRVYRRRDLCRSVGAVQLRPGAQSFRGAVGSRRGAINSGECAAWPQGFASRGKFCFRREISIILPTFPATLGLEVNMEVEAQLVNQRGCTLNLKTAKALGVPVPQRCEFQPIPAWLPAASDRSELGFNFPASVD